MKKIAWLAIVLLLIPTVLFAQYKYDGRRVWPATIDSTKQVTDLSKVLRAGTIGGVQYTEPTRQQWFPITEMVVDGTAPATAATNGTSAQSQVRVLGFDADGGTTGDDYAFLVYVAPEDYKTDSMRLYLYWEQEDADGAAADSVEWVLTVNAVASGENRNAAGTAATVTKVPVGTTEVNYVIITTINPEVEDIVAGDLVTICISVDESDSQLDSGETADLIGILVEWEAKDVP